MNKEQLRQILRQLKDTAKKAGKPMGYEEMYQLWRDCGQDAERAKAFIMTGDDPGPAAAAAGEEDGAAPTAAAGDPPAAPADTSAATRASPPPPPRRGGSPPPSRRRTVGGAAADSSSSTPRRHSAGASRRGSTEKASPKPPPPPPPPKTPVVRPPADSSTETIPTATAAAAVAPAPEATTTAAVPELTLATHPLPRDPAHAHAVPTTLRHAPAPPSPSWSASQGGPGGAGGPADGAGGGAADSDSDGPAAAGSPAAAAAAAEDVDPKTDANRTSAASDAGDPHEEPTPRSGDDGTRGAGVESDTGGACGGTAAASAPAGDRAKVPAPGAAATTSATTTPNEPPCDPPTGEEPLAATLPAAGRRRVPAGDGDAGRRGSNDSNGIVAEVPAGAGAEGKPAAEEVEVEAEGEEAAAAATGSEEAGDAEKTGQEPAHAGRTDDQEVRGPAVVRAESREEVEGDASKTTDAAAAAGAPSPAPPAARGAGEECAAATGNPLQREATQPVLAARSNSPMQQLPRRRQASHRAAAGATGDVPAGSFTARSLARSAREEPLSVQTTSLPGTPLYLRQQLVCSPVSGSPSFPSAAAPATPLKHIAGCGGAGFPDRGAGETDSDRQQTQQQQQQRKLPPPPPPSRRTRRLSSGASPTASPKTPAPPPPPPPPPPPEDTTKPLAPPGDTEKQRNDADAIPEPTPTLQLLQPPAARVGKQRQPSTSPKPKAAGAVPRTTWADEVAAQAAARAQEKAALQERLHREQLALLQSELEDLQTRRREHEAQKRERAEEAKQMLDRAEGLALEWQAALQKLVPEGEEVQSIGGGSLTGVSSPTPTPTPAVADAAAASPPESPARRLERRAWAEEVRTLRATLDHSLAAQEAAFNKVLERKGEEQTALLRVFHNRLQELSGTYESRLAAAQQQAAAAALHGAQHALPALPGGHVPAYPTPLLPAASPLPVAGVSPTRVPGVGALGTPVPAPAGAAASAAAGVGGGSVVSPTRALTDAFDGVGVGGEDPLGYSDSEIEEQAEAALRHFKRLQRKKDREERERGRRDLRQTSSATLLPAGRAVTGWSAASAHTGVRAPTAASTPNASTRSLIFKAPSERSMPPPTPVASTARDRRDESRGTDRSSADDTLAATTPVGEAAAARPAPPPATPGAPIWREEGGAQQPPPHPATGVPREVSFAVPSAEARGGGAGGMAEELRHMLRDMRTERAAAHHCGGDAGDPVGGGVAAMLEQAPHGQVLSPDRAAAAAPPPAVCPECGTPHAAVDARFCSACGAPQPQPYLPPRPAFAPDGWGAAYGGGAPAHLVTPMRTGTPRGGGGGKESTPRGSRNVHVKLGFGHPMSPGAGTPAGGGYAHTHAPRDSELASDLLASDGAGRYSKRGLQKKLWDAQRGEYLAHAAPAAPGHPTPSFLWHESPLARGAHRTPLEHTADGRGREVSPTTKWRRQQLQGTPTPTPRRQAGSPFYQLP